MSGKSYHGIFVSKNLRFRDFGSQSGLYLSHENDFCTDRKDAFRAIDRCKNRRRAGNIGHSGEQNLQSFRFSGAAPALAECPR